MGIFTISSIIIFFASLGFGIFVYSNNPTTKLNKYWLLFSSFVGIWGLSLYGVTSAGNQETALKWQYLLDVSGIFIPIFYFYFISTLLEIKNYWPKIISFVLAVIFSFFSITPLFKLGMTTKFGFFWVEPGPYYLLFPAFFIFYVLYSIFLLAKNYVEQKENIILRSQIKYQILAGIIGFSGGITNFLPQLFNVYPFGNYFILLYIFFISYSILKYKFFNIKTAATELFAGGIVILFLFNLLSATELNDWLIKLLLFILVLFFSILIVRGVFKEIESREKIELLAKDLEKANERLKVLDQQKSEFVSIASHQLRSPLTAIKGYASMVMEGSFGLVDDKVKEAIKRIFESSQHLATVVEDLLNVTKIEQGGMKFEFSKIDFRKMVKDLTEELSPNVERAGLKLSFGDNGHKSYFINADYEKLRQVVSNLIDNSIKYTPKGEIKIFIEEDDSRGVITLSIKDSGIGVPKELKDRLFEKFSRGENISKINTGGSGLGLYVAKEIVLAHKGKIWVESDGKGTGSTFIVELEEYGHSKDGARLEEFAEKL